jgi:UDP-GlcNAc:undecaprenyl-phosphate/decaprenyl-phosphate GlcNAc-1-phosphate transferase
VRDYVLVLLVAAAVTYLLTPLVRRLAARIGAMKEPRDRDVHVVPVPLIGGVAMFGGLVAGLLVADQIPLLRDGAFTNTGMVSGLLLAGGLLVVIGVIDDRWGMSALTKGAGQVAAGAILVGTGTTVNWLPLPGGNTYVPTTDQATLLTILIVVATINAVNFIDGLDGLAAGIVCIAAVSFFIYYYLLTRVIDVSSLAAPALASAILIGVCIGFLPHNFARATIFMGDTGAMLLGLLLAYAPISSIPSLQPALLTHQINRYPVIMPLLLPAALLVIPYADLLLAVVRRTRAGQSPFAPDRKHLHHRLLDIGHSQRASVLIMYLWAAVFSGIVVWLSIQRTVQPRGANHHGQPVLVFVAITAAAVVALLLIALPKLRWWGPRDRPSRPDALVADAPVAANAATASAVTASAVPAGAVALGAVPGGTVVAGAVPASAVAFGAGPAGARAAASAATQLRPPAAAPMAAPASAEPQLVTAAAGSRTPLFAAPVAHTDLPSPPQQNGSHPVPTRRGLEPSGTGTGSNGAGAGLSGTGASGAALSGTGANGAGANGALANGTAANGTGANGTGANGVGPTTTGPNGTGPSATTPAAAQRSQWPDSDSTKSRGWVEAADPERVRRPEPSPSGWTLGDRPRTERELLEFRPGGSSLSAAGPLEPGGPLEARPATGGPVDARSAPDQSGPDQSGPDRSAPDGSESDGSAHDRPGRARSIIGTPPPAVTGLDPAPASAAEDPDPQARERTSDES